MSRYCRFSPLVLLSRSLVATAIAVALLCGVSVTPARAATPQEVDAAIAKAVDFLKKSQANGNWEAGAKPDFAKLDPKGGPSEACKYGGLTAIVSYALLAAGESDQSTAMSKATKWLMDNEVRGTYASGLRSQVWLLMPESKERNAARDRDKDFLLSSAIQKGNRTGFYGYSYGAPSGPLSLGEKRVPFPPGGPAADAWFDRSNSQYGVLGVWALEQAGAEIPQKYWETIDKAWKAAQSNDGGWNYASNGNAEHERVSVTMTAAGVATLFITQDYMLKGMRWEPCKGGITNDHIENGLKYMDKHINEAITGGNYYAMYGVERIGVASGRKYFGTVDWYQVGAEFLTRNQKGDGSWSGNWGNVPDTCFALLFLVRGRAPVMMNKLMYEIAGNKKVESPWNERPRDAANLAKWMGGRVENKFLNWQIVNLKVSVDDLHDAPILYLSGAEELKFTPEEQAKLRTFVEQGGLILGNADCNSERFSKSFEKLGSELFPKYEFRQLPANHVIYTGEQYTTKKWKVHPKLRAMTNGVRELMVLVPDVDASRAWQTDSTKTRQETFELAADIFLYSIDKRNLHSKGDTYIVHPNSTPASKNLKVARLETDGNWDPEPGAWRRLSAVMHNQFGTDVAAEPVKLGAGKLADYKIASLTGTSKVIFNAAQRQEIKDFVEKGGTLIVDAAGGSTDFAESIEPELQTLFGTDAAKGLASPLLPGSPVYTAGNKITAVIYRTFARRAMTGNAKAPRLKGITVGGRLAVFYSREDLTGGLVGEQMDGIVGYDPRNSTEIMSNLLLFASGAAPAAPAADADAKPDTSASN